MKSRKPRESIAHRLTLALDAIEQAWIGRTIGIGYDCDTDTGRIKITLEPAGAPEHIVTISADVQDVKVGTGDPN